MNYSKFWQFAPVCFTIGQRAVSNVWSKEWKRLRVKELRGQKFHSSAGGLLNSSTYLLRLSLAFVDGHSGLYLIKGICRLMSQQPRSITPMFTQVDVTAAGQSAQPTTSYDEQTELLRDVLAAQDRSNELLEELVNTMSAAQKQRMNELNQWKQTNPELARSCRQAAEALSRVQIEYLDTITGEINVNAEDMMEGEFILNEFVDRFGPRLAHLNGVIQVLAQLSSLPNPANTPQ